jgi:virginiamycin B lyase
MAQEPAKGDIQISTKDWVVPTPNAKPRDVFVSKRDGAVWVSLPGVNELGRFDGKTGKFETMHLRPGSDPYHVVEHAGSGVQSRLFFTSRTGGFVAEVDSHAREVREHRVVGGKVQLYDLTFDPNGSVWFTMAKAQRPKYPQGSKVGLISPFTSEMRLAQFASNTNPYSVAVDSKGTPYVTDMDAPRIFSVHPVTLKVTEHALPNKKSGVRGLTIISDNAVWYTDRARGYLGRFEATAGKFEEFASPGGAKSQPTAIARAGNVIWYTEAGTEQLVRFDTATHATQHWPVKGIGEVEEIYVHTDGTLWFAIPSMNKVVQVTPSETK